MGDNIIKWPIEPKLRITSDNVPVSAVLRGADKVKLSSTIVLGWDKDGEFYFASSDSDGKDVLWLLEYAKKRLMEVDLNLDEVA